MTCEHNQSCACLLPSGFRVGGRPRLCFLPTPISVIPFSSCNPSLTLSRLLSRLSDRIRPSITERRTIQTYQRLCWSMLEYVYKQTLFCKANFDMMLLRVFYFMYSAALFDGQKRPLQFRQLVAKKHGRNWKKKKVVTEVGSGFFGAM